MVMMSEYGAPVVGGGGWLCGTSMEIVMGTTASVLQEQLAPAGMALRPNVTSVVSMSEAGTLVTVNVPAGFWTVVDPTGAGVTQLSTRPVTQTPPVYVNCIVAVVADVNVNRGSVSVCVKAFSNGICAASVDACATATGVVAPLAHTPWMLNWYAVNGFNPVSSKEDTPDGLVPCCAGGELPVVKDHW